MDIEAEQAEQLAQLFRFINEMDDYSLAIICEIANPGELRPGQVLTVAELARRHGISRQGMHRKVKDLWCMYPELQSILACSFMMARKLSEPPRRLKPKKDRPEPLPDRPRPTEEELRRLIKQKLSNLPPRRRPRPYRRRRIDRLTPELPLSFPTRRPDRRRR